MTLQQEDQSIVIDPDQFEDLIACADERGCSPEKVLHLALENEIAK